MVVMQVSHRRMVGARTTRVHSPSLNVIPGATLLWESAGARHDLVVADSSHSSLNAA